MLLHEPKDFRAEPCHVIFPSESEIDETVIEEEDLYVSMETTITSLVLVVENPLMPNEVPIVQVPYEFPSTEGEGRSANNWKLSVPPGIEVEVANCGDHRYMVEPADKLNEPEVPG
jgi:hypothetical protein